MKAKAILSAVTGFFLALMAYFLLLLLKTDNALWYAAFGGVLFYILLFLFLLVYEKILDKRYAEYEKEITSPILYKTNGNFTLGNGRLKNGNIYFCEAGIVCLCLEDKPYTLDEILLQDIERYHYDDTNFIIHTKDGRVFAVSLPDTQKILQVMKENGWIEH